MADNAADAKGKGAEITHGLQRSLSNLARIVQLEMVFCRHINAFFTLAALHGAWVW